MAKEIDLTSVLEKARDSINVLQDTIDVYLEEKEVNEELLAELENMRSNFPSYSAFSEVIELTREEEA